MAVLFLVTAFWVFESLSRVRNTLFIHAGRLIRPNGQLVLSMNSYDTLKMIWISISRA